MQPTEPEIEEIERREGRLEKLCGIQQVAHLIAFSAQVTLGGG